MADETSGASTAAPTALTHVKTLEEREFDLKAAQFRREQNMIPHFAALAPDHISNQIMSFCKGILGARFICEEARNDEASIFFMVNFAHDLGLKWTTIRNFFMTPGGKIGMEVNVMMALLLSKGFKVKYLKNSAEEVECWIKRPGGSDEFEMSISYTYQQAESFGWPNGKSGVKPPWRDRANMLRWRTLAACARLVAADLLGGVYLPDELEDFAPSTPYNRETKEVAADKAAEADPRLELKRLESVPVAQVIEIPKQSDKHPDPVLSPQEARNEAFLARQQTEPEKKEKSTKSRKSNAAVVPATPNHTPGDISKMAEINAEEKGISDDDLPRQNDTDPIEVPQSTPAIDAKAKLAERFKEFTDFVCGSNIHITKFCAGYLGNKEDLKDTTKLDQAMTVLEKTFNSLAGEQLKSAQKIYLEDPIQFARNVKTQQQAPPPPAQADASADDDATPIDDLLPAEWASEVCVAAYHAMQQRGLDRERFAKVMRTFDLAKLPEQDALAFFKMYYFAVDATMLAKLSASKKYPISKALADVEYEMKAVLTEKTPPTIAIRAITNAISGVSIMEDVSWRTSSEA